MGGMAGKDVRRDKAALSSGWIRSRRKQPEQAWRRRNVCSIRIAGHELVTAKTRGAATMVAWLIAKPLPFVTL
jgi:hypothetical protein